MIDCGGMASSKVMATSRNSDLKRKLSTHASSSSGTDFRRVDNSGNARDSVVSDLRNSFVERRNSSGSDQGHGSVESNSGALLNAEIKLIDTVGSTDTISDGEMERPVVVKKTVDDVWREIVEGKKSEQKPKQEMMTLEDFLAKAGAVEEEEKTGKGAIVEVKRETTLSGGIHTYGSCSGVIGMGLGVGMDVEGLGRGRGKRSMSLLEPLDKAAQQRQRRMIKNRESAARSRERKQAYQVELESMAVRLEEENERLLEEKAERSKKRLKQLMENVIPVVEKRRPSLPRLRRIRSM